MTAIEDKAREVLRAKAASTGCMMERGGPCETAAVNAMLAFRSIAIDEAAEVARNIKTCDAVEWGIGQIFAKQIAALKDTPASQVEG